MDDDDDDDDDDDEFDDDDDDNKRVISGALNFRHVFERSHVTICCL